MGESGAKDSMWPLMPMRAEKGGAEPTLYPCTIREPYLLAIPRPLRSMIAWLLICAFCSLYFVLPGLLIFPGKTAADPGWMPSQLIEPWAPDMEARLAALRVNKK